MASDTAPIGAVMSYRPVRVDGWRKLSLDQLIWMVEARLAEFAATNAYAAGERRHCTEAYLKGLEDARRLLRSQVVMAIEVKAPWLKQPEGGGRTHLLPVDQGVSAGSSPSPGEMK
jgi:hypothetical protein